MSLSNCGLSRQRGSGFEVAFRDSTSHWLCFPTASPLTSFSFSGTKGRTKMSINKHTDSPAKLTFQQPAQSRLDALTWIKRQMSEQLAGDMTLWRKDFMVWTWGLRVYYRCFVSEAAALYCPHGSGQTTNPSHLFVCYCVPLLQTLPEMILLYQARFATEFCTPQKGLGG